MNCNAEKKKLVIKLKRYHGECYHALRTLMLAISVDSCFSTTVSQASGTKCKCLIRSVPPKNFK